MKTIRYYTSADYGNKYMGWNSLNPNNLYAHTKSWLQSGHKVIIQGNEYQGISDFQKILYREI